MWNCGYNDYPTIKDSWFSAVKLAKTAGIDKFKYFGYGIGFDRRGIFSVAHGFGNDKSGTC